MNCLPRVRADHVADFEIPDGVAATAGRAGGHARRHEVGRDVARRQCAVGELRHFAQRADGIDADFRPGPRGHGGEKERQHHGHHAHPQLDSENPCQQHRGQNAGDEETENEPRHGDLDVIQRALGGIAPAAEAAEDAGKGPPQRPPLEGQRQQPTDHQHGGPRPERPGTDIAEAADLSHRLFFLLGDWLPRLWFPRCRQR